MIVFLGMNKDHELYRQWVGLTDDEDPDDLGVQGERDIYMYITLIIECIR